jgi:PIN domain nuclease of toxin-antitoxin system
VNLLLDTHTFIWWDENRPPARVTRLIQEADDVYVSAVSTWEIAIKGTLGKIAVRGTVAAAVEDYGFSALPVTIEHVDAVRTLLAHHKDPFDRLLVAQAQIEGLTMVSQDAAFGAYGVPLRRT